MSHTDMKQQMTAGLKRVRVKDEMPDGGKLGVIVDEATIYSVQLDDGETVLLYEEEFDRE